VNRRQRFAGDLVWLTFDLKPATSSAGADPL
jgi:hypothetical protein